MRIIRTSDYRAMPWKNGGGSTTEIAVFPAEASLDSFEWRVSMAHVGRDGPFSSFPGIDRTLAVLSGEGIVLASDEGSVTLERSSAPHAFPGEQAIMGRLIDGPIDDLNVMTRRGRWRHRMLRLDGPGPIQAATRGGLLMLVACSDRWSITMGELREEVGAGDSVVLEHPETAVLTGADGASIFAIELRVADAS